MTHYHRPIVDGSPYGCAYENRDGSLSPFPERCAAYVLADIIAGAEYEHRADYGYPVAWHRGLAAALEWECTSGICLGEDESDPDYVPGASLAADFDNRGWAEWERIERAPSGTVLYIQCGHCGAEYRYAADGSPMGD